jgi:hypothetical protein
MIGSRSDYISNEVEKISFEQNTWKSYTTPETDR